MVTRNSMAARQDCGHRWLEPCGDARSR